jgi:hypothetical protein
MFKTNNRKLWLVALAAAVVAGLTAPAVPAASPRLVANVHESFEVNGDVFDAGRLSVRTVKDFNPIATLNEVRVDGKSLGVVLAQVDPEAAVSNRNELIFERSRDGVLVLTSIALKGEPVRKVQPLDAQGNRVEVSTTLDRPSRVVTSR